MYKRQEYDTYKVATVANSTSTMHKIHSKPFDIDDFSHGHMTPDTLAYMQTVVDRLEQIRLKYMNEMCIRDRFAGSSSVPAHVEMMGLIGMGNNPMVGCLLYTSRK